MYRCAASPILTAKSPTRSRSALILSVGHDGSQIYRDGLMQREQREASLVDLDLEFVDSRIAGDDVGQLLVVSIDQPLEGQPQTFLGQSAHHEQTPLEGFQLPGEMTRNLVHARAPGDQLVTATRGIRFVSGWLFCSHRLPAAELNVK